MDGRTLLGDAQRALSRGDLESAHELFVAATLRFSGPAELLGGGHGWRGAAQVAILERGYERAARALMLAEKTYRLGQELLEGSSELGDAGTALELQLLEGIATCGVMRADMEIGRGRYPEARAAIDAVYPLYRRLGDRPSVADLWVNTARLAEREGRWMSARTGWAQVLRLRTVSGDEIGQCDAMIRMAEAMLVEDMLEIAEEKLIDAEQHARYLEHDGLLGRAQIGFARLFELQHDWESAWEKWLDALHSLRSSEPLLRGLSQVRMARTAARVRPAEAGDLLQKGLVDLLEGHHPDAVGLVLHQLAVVSLVNGAGKLAVLAAAGSDRARGGHDSAQGLLMRGLMRIGALEAAYLVVLERYVARGDQGLKETVTLLAEQLESTPEIDPSDPDCLGTMMRAAVDAVVGPLARAQGLPLEEVGSRRAAMKLCASATAAGSVERLQAKTPSAAPSRERAYLTWEIIENQLESFALPDGLTLVGRGSDAAVRMGWDPKASRTHCAFRFEQGQVWVRDLGSQHGTKIGGQLIDEEVEVTRGTSIVVGDTDFAIEWRIPMGAAVVVANPSV